MATGVGRPKEYKQPEVIEIARDTFWKYGYANVSTQQLCEAIHLGKGSLYNAFKNKHHLFTLSLQQYVNEGNRMQRECFLGHSTVKDGVKALLDWAISVDFNDKDTSGCFMINSYLERGNIDSEVSQIMTFHMETLKQLMTDAFIQARKNNELLEETLSIEEITEHFLMDYFGFRFMNTIAQESIDTAKKRNEMIIKAFF